MTMDSLENSITDTLAKTAQQYTVLLVEDDLDDEQQAVYMLRKSPFIYNINCFKTCDDLLRYFAGIDSDSGDPIRHIPTLIMLDIHVPGANGLETLKNLKEHPLTKNIPIIILTGDSSDKTMLDAYKLKANAFITKPLNLEHVHEVIYKGWSWPRRKIM